MFLLIFNNFPISYSLFLILLRLFLFKYGDMLKGCNLILLILLRISLLLSIMYFFSLMTDSERISSYIISLFGNFSVIFLRGHICLKVFTGPAANCHIFTMSLSDILLFANLAYLKLFNSLLILSCFFSVNIYTIQNLIVYTLFFILIFLT